MAKKMKKQRKKRGFKWFAFGMVVYAVVFLGAVAFGLKYLWSFLAAYEATRPDHAIEAYMEQLTVEHICDSAAELIAQIDHNIQGEDECRSVILSALDGEITYARKAAECTETKQVYVLRCNKQVIGSFAIESGAVDEYGFASWSQTEESFDLSFLIGNSVSTTVPAQYPVYVNGVQLDTSYVTGEETTPYGLFDEFYDDYDLPSYVTYTYEAGPFLGELEIHATDLEGNAFQLDDSFDSNVLIDNCSETEVQEMDAFVNEFIKRYVAFTGSANRSRYDNFDKVAELVVPGTTFLQRMEDAIEGLYFAQSKGDEIDSITINQRYKIEDGKYLCDVTYLVNTTGFEGVVQTDNNAKIILVESGDGLLVETMISY